MLLLDRFLGSGISALDLATGETVRVRIRPRPPLDVPLTRRGHWYLVDAGPHRPRGFVEAWGRAASAPPAVGACTDAIRDALADARDGCPRAIDIVAGTSGRWRRAVHDIARAATTAGFVPLDAEVLGEVLRSARWRWPRWLRERSLVVLTRDGGVSGSAALALLRLATRDARPHIVVRGSTTALGVATRVVRQPSMVHDAPGDTAWSDAPTTTVVDLVDEAWQRAAAGEADDRASALARWAIVLAPDADAETGARAALARTLAAQGRPHEARAVLAGAGTDAMDVTATQAARLADTQQALQAAEAPRRDDRIYADDFLRVLELCQETADEAVALGQVMALLRDRLAATSLACATIEEGHLRVLAQAGAAPGDMTAARQAISSGHRTLPAGTGTLEGAWVVRYASQVVGALSCRWIGRTGVPVEAADALMTLAARAVAPLVQVVAERGRPSTAAPDIPDLVGDSDVMRALRAAVVRAARSPFPVLIEGESGAGKELVARAIHAGSPRRDRRLCALNCAALTEDLAEAELFGHARGAFTGAVAERAGLFEEATGGTLFLDEVSELSPRIQAKLLRVLQEHEVRRLGEAHVRRIDARIVAASNRPLAAEVEAGRFRRDLRYRLDVLRLQVPPLRERLDDLPALARHLWAGLCARTGSRAVLSASALAALGRYDWPGNVRELQNVLTSLMVTAPPRGAVTATALPAHVGQAATLVDARSLAEARRAFETRYVRAALARADGRVGLAARDLGVSRQGLTKLLGRLGIAGDAGIGERCRRIPVSERPPVTPSLPPAVGAVSAAEGGRVRAGVPR